MKVSTTRAFRKLHINSYSRDHFGNGWDYFLYLHINDATRYVHFWGTIIGSLLFPIAMYMLYKNLNNYGWYLACLFFYYFTGFISHFIFDGHSSETWRQFFKSYKYALKMNHLTLLGRWPEAEKEFFVKYPEVAWVYSQPQSTKSNVRKVMYKDQWRLR